MKLRLLSLAEADLLRGFDFYEQQDLGVGTYFLETLYSDIESLRLYAGIHRQVYGYHRLLSRRFPRGLLRYLCGRNQDMARIGLSPGAELDPAAINRIPTESMMLRDHERR